MIARLLIAMGLVGLLWVPSAVAEDELTLINGTVLRGSMGSVEEGGVEMSVDGATRMVPWSMIAMSDRHRLDARFRENIEAILAGEPPSAYQDVEGDRFADWVDEPVEEASPPVRLDPPVWAFRAPLHLRASSLSTWDESAYRTGWVFQYGIDPDHVAVVAVHDPDGDGVFSQLFVYDEQTKVGETARRYTRGRDLEPLLAFRRVSFRSRSEATRIDSDLTFTLPAPDVGILGVEAEVRVARGSESLSFHLAGYPPLVSLEGGPWVPTALLAPPSLAVRAVRDGEDIVVKVGLLMDVLGVFPQGRMSRMVRVEGMDDDGQRVTLTDIELPEAMSYDRTPGEGRLSDASSVARVVATIDLGPLMGMAEGETSLAPIPASTEEQEEENDETSEHSD
jgi:hypothetical protein